MNECYRRVQATAEAQVTRVYEELMKKACSDALRVTLRDSQDARAKYRTRQCDLEAYSVGGGSVHPETSKRA